MTLLILHSHLEVLSAALHTLQMSRGVLLPLFPSCVGAAGWQVCDCCLEYGQGEGSGAGQRDPDLLEEQANTTSPHVYMYLAVLNWYAPTHLTLFLYNATIRCLQTYTQYLWSKACCCDYRVQRPLSFSGRVRTLKSKMLWFSLALLLAVILSIDSA